MSNRELAKSLIDQIPESKLFYIIPYLQGAAIPDDIPNAETIAAMEECADIAAHPEKYKGYTDVDEMMKELLA